ncbi:DgyrCDS11398 [Dimorphilus gyrociliatus]|uniref:DgyrCDS11398 n=1 Tax=Dimorphilus gyrociliatus TaxID=2664684 RepID=A0A7I8W3C6_9ANNE|nr:DgyrCDS11398 [Dimorphilus gyrociliatus]
MSRTYIGICTIYLLVLVSGESTFDFLRPPPFPDFEKIFSGTLRVNEKLRDFHESLKTTSVEEGGCNCSIWHMENPSYISLAVIYDNEIDRTCPFTTTVEPTTTTRTTTIEEKTTRANIHSTQVLTSLETASFQTTKYDKETSKTSNEKETSGTMSKFSTTKSSVFSGDSSIEFEDTTTFGSPPTIQPPFAISEPKSMNTVIYAIVGAAVGLFILLLVICLCYRKHTLRRKNRESLLISSSSIRTINEDIPPVQIVSSVDTNGYDGFGDSTTDTIRRKTLSRSSKLLFEGDILVPVVAHLPEAEEDLDNNYLYNLDSEKIISTKSDKLERMVEGDDNNNIEGPEKEDSISVGKSSEESISKIEKPEEQPLDNEAFEIEIEECPKEFGENIDDPIIKLKPSLELTISSSDYGSNETDSIGTESKIEESQTPTTDYHSDRDESVSVDHYNPLFDSNELLDDESKLRKEEDINLTIGRIKPPTSDEQLDTAGRGNVKQMRALFENLAEKAKKSRGDIKY